MTPPKLASPAGNHLNSPRRLSIAYRNQVGTSRKLLLVGESSVSCFCLKFLLSVTPLHSFYDIPRSRITRGEPSKSCASIVDRLSSIYFGGFVAAGDGDGFAGEGIGRVEMTGGFIDGPGLGPATVGEAAGFFSAMRDARSLSI